MDTLVDTSRRLRERVGALRFARPVTHVYNPLDYARESHERYLAQYGTSPKEVVLLGMNPGPFGMAQTGVPFGDVAMVRDWLGISTPVGRPREENPKRPVLGFACTRSEVSGTRLWGWARQRFGTPQRFFQRFYVANYCPLAFMAASGVNVTPDKLPATERAPLFAACDEALRETIALLRPRFLIGIGKFAADRARLAVDNSAIIVGSMLHPSPASPRANTGWEAIIERELRALGVPLG